MENNIKLLDGSMSYPLELDGYNLNNRLWTGDALINNPELIKKIHKGYINSGADYLLTSTYQISYDILKEIGINSEEIKELLTFCSIGCSGIFSSKLFFIKVETLLTKLPKSLAKSLLYFFSKDSDENVASIPKTISDIR